MTERGFRLIQGSWLLAALLLNSAQAVVALECLLLFEGLTNWRIPVLVSRLRYGSAAPSPSGGCCDAEAAARLPFEAERALRLVVLTFLVVSYQLLPQYLWWAPWFVGFALVGAGFSGICPMVLALRFTGFR